MYISIYWPSILCDIQILFIMILQKKKKKKKKKHLKENYFFFLSFFFFLNEYLQAFRQTAHLLFVRCFCSSA